MGTLKIAVLTASLLAFLGLLGGGDCEINIDRGGYGYVPVVYEYVDYGYGYYDPYGYDCWDYCY